MPELPKMWTFEAGWAVIWEEHRMGEASVIWCIASHDAHEPYKRPADMAQWFLYTKKEFAKRALRDWKASDNFDEDSDFSVHYVQFAAVATVTEGAK